LDIDENIIGWPATARFYSAEEQSILRIVAKGRAEPLTHHELFLSLEQARHLGEIGERPEEAAKDANRR
jgi:hypothetical protein